MSIRVLIPTFRDRMLERCLASLEYSQAGSGRHVLLLDNGLTGAWTGYDRITVPATPFIAAQAFNIGCQASPHEDIVWLDDSAEIISDAWLVKLERVLEARRHQNYGVLIFSQPTTRATYGRQPEWYEILDIPDVAMGAGILIPRSVLMSIGGMDETLRGYGFDDFDYGMRCYHVGYKLGITGAVQVTSGPQASGWVARLGSWEAVLAKQDENFERFYRKWWGVVPDRPWLPVRPVEADHWLRQACACEGVDYVNAA